MENDDPVEERSEEASNRVVPGPAVERNDGNSEATADVLRSAPSPAAVPVAAQQDGDGNVQPHPEERAWDVEDLEAAVQDADSDDTRPWGDESPPNSDPAGSWGHESPEAVAPWGDESPAADDARPWGEDSPPNVEPGAPWGYEEDMADAVVQEDFVPWGEEDRVEDGQDAIIVPWGDESPQSPEPAAAQDGDSDVSIVDGGAESSSENGMDRSSNSSENGLDDSDADRLFDDYIQNREQQQDAEIYNTELPTEHAYLGKLERVEGVDYLEPGKTYCLPVYSHHSIVFPGEVVPMILNAASLNYEDQSDGVKFGLLFRTTFPNNYIYGVTCQVFERGEQDLNGSIILKTVAQQRFHVVRQVPNRRAEVKILPEIILPDPLLSSCSNLMKRHAVSNSKKYSHRFKSFVSHAMTWPKFVYDFYGTEDVLTKVDRYLAFLKITSVPSDPVKLSFWLARNIPIDERDRKLIYQADAVISRMLIINKSLDHMCYFLCKRCDNEIGSYNDIFAMNKQGVQTSYCNPSGYVHETLTIYKTKENSTFTVDRPSTEFSWFPGYSWQITLCCNCRQHLGWKFVATKNNYLPKSFYGLSGNNIKVKSVNEPSTSRRADTDRAQTPAVDSEEAEDQRQMQLQQQQRVRRIQQLRRQQRRQQRMDQGEVVANEDEDDDDDISDDDLVYEVIDFGRQNRAAININANADAAVQANAPVLMLERIDDEETEEGADDEEDEDRFQDARE